MEQLKNLSHKTILVNIKISQWAARKLDKKVTAEVNQNHKTSDAGRFNKILIDPKHLRELSQIATELREFHYENTLPWADGGDRLLTNANYFAYTEKLMELKNKFENARKKFVAHYPIMISEAQQRLNGLFIEKDYPKASEIEEKFDIKNTFMPVPEVDDIRIGLSADDVTQIKEKVQAEISERYIEAQKDIYKRMVDQLSKMRERLKDTESVFRDSLFQNLLDLVNLLPKLNITGDKVIDDLCAEMKAVYTDPESVRNDTLLRKKKLNEVNDILSKIDGIIKF
jgi:hypothetical protein